MYTPKGKIQLIETDQLPAPVFSSVTGNRYEGVVRYNPVTDQYFDESGNVSLIAEVPSGKYEDIATVERVFYDNVIKDDDVFNLRVTKPLESFTPTISEEDRKIGFIVRYFAQRLSDGEVLEISPQAFKSISTKQSEYHYPSYIVGRTEWKISGPVANEDINGYIVLGAEEINKSILSSLEKVLPNIRTYLTDPTQFVE